jgi:hypothetical protein
VPALASGGRAAAWEVTAISKAEAWGRTADEESFLAAQMAGIGSPARLDAGQRWEHMGSGEAAVGGRGYGACHAHTMVGRGRPVSGPV